MPKPGTISYHSLKIQGQDIKAAAPVVISASRATDIPAFYPSWFQQQLKQGFVRRMNPFSGKPYFISLANASAFVFWTKNPAPFFPVLKNFTHDFYFQFSLNNYDGTGLEPMVPPMQQRIDTFRYLAERYGPSRVLWRFDPLLILPHMPVDDLIERIELVASLLMGYTQRMTISFLTLHQYRKARQSLMEGVPGMRRAEEAIPGVREQGKILHYLENLQQRWKKQDSGFSIQACAMPEDLSPYGIYPSRCIDDELLASLFPENKPLMHFLGRSGLFTENIRLPDDKGQRRHCHCIPSKDIGAYNTCRHGCLYCYANK